MGQLFDQFKRVLTFAVTDAELAKRNALLADPAYKADLMARIAALTGESVIYLGLAEVESVDGAWSINPEEQIIEYDPEAAQEESTITFIARALPVPMRVRDVVLRGVLPASDDGSAPDARSDLSLDTSVPDPLALSSLQVRIRLVLNGQPTADGWFLREVVVLLAQE